MHRLHNNKERKVKNKESKSIFSLTLQSTTYGIYNRCLLHEWLKKTMFVSKASYIVNSMYTASYTDQCTSCNIIIDHPFGAALDIRKGGGDITKIEIWPEKMFFWFNFGQT